MNTLHVRNVPDEIYVSLKRKAQARKSSISVETLRLLSRAIEADYEHLENLFSEIESRRGTAKIKAPLIADWLREERTHRS